MRPGSEPYRSSVLLKLTITMRLWMIGIFCLAAVQILAPAAGTNEIAGAAVETTTEVMDNHTMPAADGSATVAAVDSTRMAVAVVNNTVAPAVESTTAAAGNNTMAAAVETTTVAAGNDTAKVAVKNTGGAAGNKVDVAAGKNTAKVAMNDTRVAAGKKIRVGASNNTRVAAGFKIGVDVAKETGKVAVSSATTAAVESTTADAGNYSETAPSNTAAAFGSVPERSLRGIRSVGNEELNTGFAERIKNWFRRLINRMFGKKRNETTTPRPEDETAPVVELDKEDLLFIRRNPRRFNVNLTALTFDPKRDWGFRLGKWLIIRKVSPWKKTEGRLRGSHPRRSTTVEPTTPADDFPSETPATARSTSNYPPYRSNTASPTPSDPTDTASSMVTDAPRSTTFEEATPTPEAPAKGTTKVPDSTDKDTGEKKRDQSVEIIGPKE